VALVAVLVGASLIAHILVERVLQIGP
jgi:hypothetical protein